MRLNDHYVIKDLRDFLEKQSPFSGSYAEILVWLSAYENSIVNNHKIICDKFGALCPKAIVKLFPCEDGELTYMVDIYGAAFDKETKEKIHDLADTISREDLGDDYLLIASFKNLEITKQYYPDIYEELMAKEQK